MLIFGAVYHPIPGNYINFNVFLWINSAWIYFNNVNNSRIKSDKHWILHKGLCVIEEDRFGQVSILSTMDDGQMP